MTRRPTPIRAIAGLVLAIILTAGTVIAAGSSAPIAGAEQTATAANMATSTTLPKVPDTFPDQTAPEVSIPSIIPQPNSGVAPKSATDRGGWAQYSVLSGIIVALGILFLLVVRDSRKKKRAQAA